MSKPSTNDTPSSRSRSNTHESQGDGFPVTRMMLDNLRAFGEIGTGGCRFSISSIDPKHARLLPFVFQDKVSISLTDGDHPISASITDEVIALVCRFKTICLDYGCPLNRIELIGGTGLRDVPNVQDFSDRLKECTDLSLKLLSKEAEYGVSLYGMVSSFHYAHGLYLKLGSSYIHMNWISAGTGQITAGQSPITLPFGLKHLSKRLKCNEHAKILEEIKGAFTNAITSLDIPEDLKRRSKSDGGYRLFLNGNSFREVSSLLLGRHPDYPIPIANGYGVTPHEWLTLPQSFFEKRANEIRKSGNTVKADHFLAACFLLSTVIGSLENVRKVLYNQIWLREGLLFHQLSPQYRRLDPVIVATQPFALPGARAVSRILLSALPADAPEVISRRILPALANAAYVHCSYPQELQASMGLMIATSGILSSCGGLSHETRALLGIALCGRWGGEVTEQYTANLQKLTWLPIEVNRSWWAHYIGYVMYVVGAAYPGARVRSNILTLSVKGTASKFTLNITCNRNSIFANNYVTIGRLNGLQRRLDVLKEELGSHSPDMTLNIQWVSEVTAPESSRCNSNAPSNATSTINTVPNSPVVPPLTIEEEFSHGAMGTLSINEAVMSPKSMSPKNGSPKNEQ